MFHQLNTVLVLAVLAPLSLGAPQFFSSAPPLKSISLRRIYDSLNKAFIGGYSIDVADKEVDLSKYTINEILEAARKGQDPSHLASPVNSLRRLADIVHRSPDAQDDLEADDITLIAPDNAALTPPQDEDDRSLHPFHHLGDDDSDKQRLSRLIAFLLRYHTLDRVETLESLASLSTVPTTLDSDKDDDEPLRVRVEPVFSKIPFVPPTISFNFESLATGDSIRAKNGRIIPVSRALLPPFTPLNDLLLMPELFGAFTSDLQKVGLDRVVLPKREHIPFGDDLDDAIGGGIIDELIGELISESPKEDFTIFSLTNLAYNRLGQRASRFLHSPLPISRRALKYILAYHIVPSVAFYSDYNSNSSAIDFLGYTHQDESKVTHYRLPTLLSRAGINDRATLLVDVVAFKRSNSSPLERTVVIVPHKEEQDYRGGDDSARAVRVWRADAPARQGAVHAINDILIPPYKHEHDRDLVAVLDAIFA